MRVSKAAWGLLLAGILGSSAALADALEFNLSARTRTQGFVEIRKDREIYVDWMPGKKDFPAIVLLNGLTYSTSQWDRFAESLNARGFGVLRYDMQGMGRTLLKYAPVLKVIEVKDQVADLKALLDHLDVDAIHVAGLSYGGAVAVAFAAAYPTKAQDVILMAPFTEPIEGQDQWIKGQIWATRRTQPWNTATDDELYDFFLRQIVYSTYPVAEPIVLENPFKLEAVYRLVQGVRKWNAFDTAAGLPGDKVHMVVAGSDQYIPVEKMEKFWTGLSPRQRRSWIKITDAEHKIPEDVPVFAAAWVAEILKGNPQLRGGARFEGDSYTGVVKGAGGIEIRLPIGDSRPK